MINIIPHLKMNSIFLITVDCVSASYMAPWETVYSTGYGTGFCIAIKDKLYILTAYHVIEDAKLIKVNYVETKVLFMSKLLDVALLEYPDGLTFLGELTDRETISGKPLYPGIAVTGDEITSYGYPIYADTLSKTNGIISRLMKYDRGSVTVLAYHTDAAVNAGNSGGPVINSGGQYVGMVVAKQIDAENMNIIIPFFVIKYFIDSIASSLDKNIENPLYFMVPTFTWQYKDEYMSGTDPVIIITKDKQNKTIRESANKIENIDITATGNIRYSDFLKYYGYSDVIDDQEIPFYYIIPYLCKNTVLIGDKKYDLHKEVYFHSTPQAQVFGDFIFAPITDELMTEYGHYISYINGEPRTIILVSNNKRYMHKILDIGYYHLIKALKDIKKTIIVPFYNSDWELHLNADQKNNDRLINLFK